MGSELPTNPDKTVRSGGADVSFQKERKIQPLELRDLDIDNMTPLESWQQWPSSKKKL